MTSSDEDEEKCKRLISKQSFVRNTEHTVREGRNLFKATQKRSPPLASSRFAVRNEKMNNEAEERPGREDGGSEKMGARENFRRR